MIGTPVPGMTQFPQSPEQLHVVSAVSVTEWKDTVALWLLWIFCHFSLILVRKTCLLRLGLNMRGKRGSKLQKIQHWWLNQEEELEHRFSLCFTLALRRRKTCGRNTSCCPTAGYRSYRSKKPTMIFLFLIISPIQPRLCITVSSILVTHGIRWFCCWYF